MDKTDEACHLFGRKDLLTRFGTASLRKSLAVNFDIHNVTETYMWSL